MDSDFTGPCGATGYIPFNGGPSVISAEFSFFQTCATAASCAGMGSDPHWTDSRTLTLTREANPPPYGDALDEGKFAIYRSQDCCEPVYIVVGSISYASTPIPNPCEGIGGMVSWNASLSFGYYKDEATGLMKVALYASLGAVSGPYNLEAEFPWPSGGSNSMEWKPTGVCSYDFHKIVGSVS